MSDTIRQLLSTCWDTVRRDAGVTNDHDALVQIAWLLLLKHADDVDRENEALAVLSDQPHTPIVPPPYRWRDWAKALPGAGLEFFSHDRSALADGTEGRGLLAAVADLDGAAGAGEAASLRESLARSLRAARRPMQDRATVEAVLRTLDGLDLASAAGLAQAVAWFEERLAEVRADDAALPSLGSVPETLARMLAPEGGETALDLAFGDAGFLLAAHDQATGRSHRPGPVLTGSETDPDLYLLAMTRLVLRGVDAQGLYLEDAFNVQATELGDEARADVLLGAHDRSRGSVGPDVAAGFPLELRSSDPALLYLQLAVRRLRRAVQGAGQEGGRAAIVLPDRALSGPGVGARVRRSLLELVRLRAVIHLPKRQASDREATSVLLFDRGGATETVWFYEVAPDEALENVVAWWREPVTRPGVRRVALAELIVEEDGEVVTCDLDLRKAPEPEPEVVEEELVVALPEVDAERPPLIERPELQGLARSALFASLTGLAWGVWAYLWLPAITLLAWVFGVRLFRDQVALVDPEPYVLFLGWWSIAIGAVLVLLLLWAAYNIVRYSGARNRRRSTPALSLEDVADGFGVDVELVQRLRRSRIVTIDPDLLSDARVQL